MVHFVIFTYRYSYWIVGYSNHFGLKELISVFVELLKARLSIKIVECNAKIDKLNNSINKSVKVIGFTTTTSEEEEENYE